ncbi:DUF3187 family protein [Caldimonas sp. KR1-144]|uniref:DUF3187 family protein n=1 Tax=Caldimonas sp. KR1-144 TaxID=3400911 RepID=UPI003C013D1A
MGLPVFEGRNLRAAISVSSALLLCTALHAEPAHDDAGIGFAGLLPVRDMTTFGFRRLDMRPAPVTTDASRPAIEFAFGYQNTWSTSSDVRDYLQTRPRSAFTGDDVERLRATPGEHYLVDMELAMLDVTVRYPLSPRLDAYAMVSAAQFTGGRLDGMIESFHRRFGFDDFGRPGAARNRFNLYLDLKGVKVQELNRDDLGGLLDPVVGLRYTWPIPSQRMRVVAEAAAKLPLESNGLMSTGRADVGTQVTAQWFRHAHAFYVSAAVVRFAGSPAPYRNASTTVPTGIFGYEYRWDEKTNVVAQLSTSRSTFTSRETDLEELRGMKYQVSLGLRHCLQAACLTAAVTENVMRFNNTPDVGFLFGAGFDLQ